jgi:Leucine-rich repeat (LRR) protein
MNHKSLLSTAAASGLQLGSGLRRIVCLAALLVVFATTARAYDLWVGGVQVTTSNASDITGSNIKGNLSSVNGGNPKVNYVSSTNTLYLYNVKIERTGKNNHAIENKGMNGLRIVLRGQNVLKATGSSAVRLDKNTTITTTYDGNQGKTSIEGGSEDALYVSKNGSDDSPIIEIKDAVLDVKSESSCFDTNCSPILVIDNSTLNATCSYNKSGDCYAVFDFNLLTVRNSTVTLTGHSQAIKNLASLNLGTDMCIETPSGGSFNSSSKTVVNSSGNAASTVVFKMMRVAVNSTNFPDANFRNWLLKQSYGEDGYLTFAEIAAVTEISVRSVHISSLKGIEYFQALKRLDCSGNDLKTLSVSNNTALTYLKFYSNRLTTLDVSNNTALKELDCRENDLNSLDVSNNTALETLYCANNDLTTLNVSKNTALKELDCQNNSLTSLDVSKNTALKELDCQINSLTSLDVSKNTALETLNCHNNSLTSLDVSKNTALIYLYCYDNDLKTLNVSKNTALDYLNCAGNQISGDAMANLVNSLPFVTGDCSFIVCDDNRTPDNVITTVQVEIATDNGWKVKKYNKRNFQVDYVGLGDVNGDNKIDQTDLDTIVDIIMGRVNLGYAGDLNNDGKTNAADVVKMVNVFRSLGKGIW